MAKENFLLVSLEEAESQQLAEVLSNDTSRKIINYLTEQDATETKIAEVLEIPLSTVHYNLQKLKEAGLVRVEEFHYSKKGREVLHYKLANKYIIITAKPVKGIKQQLRHVLPAGGIIAGLSVILYVVEKMYGGAQVAAIKAADIVQEAPLIKAVVDAEMIQDGGAAYVIEQVMRPWWTSIALWFAIGSVTALLAYFIVYRLRSRRKP